jgi:glycerol-3-phosphate acyltransferase PlsY
MLSVILFLVLSYLAGSVSTAIIVCRMMGLPDPRREGSHNPGATNVLRIGGKRAAAVTLAGDFLKGFLPVLLAHLVGLNEIGLALTAIAAFLGHLYPLFFGFAGGKGVATAFGTILGLSWPLALLVSGTWSFMTILFRISSLSALTAAVLTPLFGWLLGLSWLYMSAILCMVILLIWRHRSNISNLISGVEGHAGSDCSIE